MLPARATSFVGREQQLALVRETLASGRLVTLVGPGGVGKTRLAQQAAAGEGPVWWVDQAPSQDPTAVPQARADALGLEAHQGTPWTASAVGAWRRRSAGRRQLRAPPHRRGPRLSADCWPWAPGCDPGEQPRAARR